MRQGDRGVPRGRVVEGRLYVFCVSCARRALLDNDETAGDRKSRVRVETRVFVRTVCGGCERAEQDRSGAGQRGGITTDTT